MLQSSASNAEITLPSAEREDLSRAHTAQHLLHAQAEFLGVTAETIRNAEVTRGKEFHPAVSLEQIDAIAAHYRLAQKDFLSTVEKRRDEPAINVLCAPTARTVDLIIDQRALYALAQKLLDRGEKDRLLKAINTGPEDGQLIWEKPQNEVELLASIVRWAALCGAEKKRVRAPDSLRKSVAQDLEEADIKPLERLGGAAAIATALMPILARSPTMLSLGPLPPPVLKHLPGNTAVVTEDPAIKEASSLALAQDFTGNFHLVFKGAALELPPELGPICVNQKTFDAQSVKSLDIIISGSSQISGFGSISISRTEALGCAHELTLLTGMQYLLSHPEIKDYFEHVSTLHSNGSRIALFYSEAKQPKIESEMWQEIKERKCVDFIGLNSVEAYDILVRIRARAVADNPIKLSSETIARLDQALQLGADDGGVWESGKESPQWLYASARSLQEVSGIPLVRVRGKVLDVIATDPKLKLSAAEHLRDSQIVSRNLGTLKVANSSGVINESHELEPLINVPHGYHLAGLQQLKDYVLNQGEDAAQNLHLDCYFKTENGGYVFAVPPVPFFSRRGGTASAGDTIDATFASEECFGALDDAHRFNLKEMAAFSRET